MSATDVLTGINALLKSVYTKHLMLRKNTNRYGANPVPVLLFLNHFTPDPEPVKMPPADPFHPEMNTYDPRITKIGDEYIIIYASDLLQNDARLGILRTKDFETFERVCTGSELGNRNGALFPEKHDGLYFRLDRPCGNELEPCSMWMSFSPDLVYWGQSRPVMYKGKPFRDGFKNGCRSSAD